MTNNEETETSKNKDVVIHEIKGGIVAMLSKSEEAKVHEIQEEFRRGIESISQFKRSVTFYGSALIREDHPSYKQVYSLSYKIAKELNNYAILSGGGGGVMEAANRGAFDGGANSIGLTIKLPNEQKTNKYVTDEIPFNFFFSRQAAMSYSTEVCIFCAGGYGTLDELFELLTLQHTKKIGRFPIILFGVDFWNPIKKMLEEVMLEKYKTIEPADLEYFTITDNEDEVIEIIKNSKLRDGDDVLKLDGEVVI